MYTPGDPGSRTGVPGKRSLLEREANLGLFLDWWNPRSQNRDLGHPGSVVYLLETADPGYNRDRGPVIIPGVRSHVDF